MQIFPDPESVIRLVGALLCEVNDGAVAESLPFADDGFDVGLAVLTVHHWYA